MSGLIVKQMEWRKKDTTYDNEEIYKSKNRLYTVVLSRFSNKYECMFLQSSTDEMGRGFETAEQAKSECQRHFEEFIKKNIES